MEKNVLKKYVIDLAATRLGNICFSCVWMLYSVRKSGVLSNDKLVEFILFLINVLLLFLSLDPIWLKINVTRVDNA